MEIEFIGINVGNSRTRVGAFRGDKLIESTSAFNDDAEMIGQQIEQAHGLVGEHPDARVVLASVNPDIEVRVMEGIIDRIKLPVSRMGQDIPVPIGRQLDHETIVGVDRLLNAAAAYDVLKQACVVVDAGTAVTVDFIDGVGTFHGGAIAPGAQMMLDSMHRDAALLPELTIAKPDEPIGHNTAQAMLSGVYHGLRGMVHELVERYAHVAGTYPMVVATGGDAELLFGDDEIVERVVPELTLMGIAVAMRAAASEGS